MAAKIAVDSSVLIKWFKTRHEELLAEARNLLAEIQAQRCKLAAIRPPLNQQNAARKHAKRRRVCGTRIVIATASAKRETAQNPLSLKRFADVFGQNDPWA
jgi:hypothetical protein